jgi:predicted secreted protein
VEEADKEAKKAPTNPAKATLENAIITTTVQTAVAIGKFEGAEFLLSFLLGEKLSGEEWQISLPLLSLTSLLE